MDNQETADFSFVEKKSSSKSLRIHKYAFESLAKVICTLMRKSTMIGHYLPKINPLSLTPLTSSAKNLYQIDRDNLNQTCSLGLDEFSGKM
jgi:hypothetical protein